jgi:hypothetical protein
MSMLRASALLLFVLTGCVGTESRQAFTPRPPAAIDPPANFADNTAEHNRSLQDAIDRALEAQDDAERYVRPTGGPVVDGEILGAVRHPAQAPLTARQ